MKDGFRNDWQIWISAQRLTFEKVINRMQDIIDGLLQVEMCLEEMFPIWVNGPFHQWGNSINADVPRHTPQIGDDQSDQPNSIGDDQLPDMTGATQEFANQSETPLCNTLHDLDIRDDCDNDAGDSSNFKSVYSRTVTVLDKATSVYKATLVSLLNDEPKLLKDRLTRVCQKQEYSGPGVVTAGDTTKNMLHGVKMSSSQQGIGIVREKWKFGGGGGILNVNFNCGFFCIYSHNMLFQGLDFM